MLDKKKADEETTEVSVHLLFNFAMLIFATFYFVIQLFYIAKTLPFDLHLRSFTIILSNCSTT